jgi:hypothetical protein
MEEAVDIYRRMKDDRNKMDLANTLNSLAALYWNQSEFDRAEVLVPIFKERRDVRAKGMCWGVRRQLTSSERAGSHGGIIGDTQAVAWRRPSASRRDAHQSCKCELLSTRAFWLVSVCFVCFNADARVRVMTGRPQMTGRPACMPVRRGCFVKAL